MKKILKFLNDALSKISHLSSKKPPTQTRAFSWKELLQDGKHPLWLEALEKAKSGQRILIATSVGGFGPATTMESLIAVALRLRGCDVRFLLCDAFMPACMKVHMGLLKTADVIADDRLQKEVCPGCWETGRKFYESTGLPLERYSSYCTEEEAEQAYKLAKEIPVDEIASYQIDGIAVGEHAKAGALRFFSRGTLEGEPRGEEVLRQYFLAALKTKIVIERVFETHKIDFTFFHHGIYVPQGIIGEVARKRGVKLANWQVAYRKGCFICSHQETYHHALLSEPVEHWKNIPWSKALEKKTLDYLKSRWYGTEDWIWFHTTPQHDADLIRKELNLKPDLPIISLLTNVFWDAQLHYRANAFPNMLVWILDSIEYFKSRPDLQLVIRIHPAEITGSIKSRQPLEDEIAKAYPVLPANVKIVSPASQLSTYTLCDMSDTVLIYGTKTGVEITAVGIPVIVAGEAWIRNKGLTEDASSPEEYRSLLETLPKKKRMPQEQIQLARKYAFHFFYRRFIPVSSLAPNENNTGYKIGVNGLEQLVHGEDPGLDVICNGIMQGEDFIYPSERYL